MTNEKFTPGEWKMENKTCGNCKRYRPSGKSCDIFLSIRDIEKNNRCCKFFDALPKMTNGDRIRQMSNKEMAVMFRTDIKQCPPGECHDDGCIECWLEWLNSEVKE